MYTRRIHIDVPSEERGDCGRAVKSGIGIRLGGFVKLTSASETGQSIEQTRTHEADDSEHDNLRHRGVEEDFEASIALE